jgi:hypothetical protein
MMTISYQPTGHPVVDDSITDIGNGDPGGRVKKFLVAGVALNIGDAVQLSAIDSVTKTVTTTNHKNRMGIVVGGTQTDMRALLESTDLGILAGNVGEQVLVLYSGIAWAKADTTTVVFGDKVKLGTTTAGRVLDGSDTTDLAAGITGSIIGTALDSPAAAGDPVRVLVSLG